MVQISASTVEIDASGASIHMGTDGSGSIVLNAAGPVDIGASGSSIHMGTNGIEIDASGNVSLSTTAVGSATLTVTPTDLEVSCPGGTADLNATSVNLIAEGGDATVNISASTVTMDVSGGSISMDASGASMYMGMFGYGNVNLSAVHAMTLSAGNPDADSGAAAGVTIRSNDVSLTLNESGTGNSTFTQKSSGNFTVTVPQGNLLLTTLATDLDPDATNNNANVTHLNGSTVSVSSTLSTIVASAGSLILGCQAPIAGISGSPPQVQYVPGSDQLSLCAETVQPPTPTEGSGNEVRFRVGGTGSGIDSNFWLPICIGHTQYLIPLIRNIDVSGQWVS